MAKTILKTYEVTYILGTINPETRTIKISSINDLTEDYIRNEILRQKPHYKNQIGAILSTLLIEEKVIDLQDLKKDLMDNYIGNGDKGANFLSADDIKFLLD